MLTITAVMFVAGALVLANCFAICHRRSCSHFIPDCLITAIGAWVGGTLMLGFGPTIGGISIFGAIILGVVTLLVIKQIVRSLGNSYTSEKPGPSGFRM
jgi:hypothetical protein